MIQTFILQILSSLFTFLPVQNDRIWVDQFNEPLEESWKNRYEECNEIYRIEEQAENKYLSAFSTDSDCFIVKPIKVDITKYPYLNWKWKAKQLPVNGDESVKKYCDVAASVTIVLNKSKFFPKSIKYTWSTTLEEDSFTKSPYAMWPAKCAIHVLRSGEQKEEEWIHEKVNVLEDYKKLYKKKRVKSKNVYALVIMSDSDNTNTPAAADYDDLFFSSH